mmetsp:Transcript_93310/g.165105  ORF Transcript_93310/g.165105 Transcript_93310/m.165105 type:complete len:169 (+) Transcript_93310:78-584(+)
MPEEEDKDDESKEKSEGLPISQASIQQLNMVKQQLEQELGSLGRNQEALREAEMRFNGSIDCLQYLTPESEGKPMMVPLTSSLYVDGRMSSTSSLIVDVGTGYFVEMSTKRATDFCQRRVKMLSENAAKVEKVMKEKRKNLETVTVTMQQKLYKAQAEQEAAKSAQQR